MTVNYRILAAAQKYLGHRTSTFAPHTISSERGTLIASIYDTAQEQVNTASRRAYYAFGRETTAMWDLMTSLIDVEVWDRPGDPYPEGKYLWSDVREHRHMFIFDHYGPYTPCALMTPEQYSRWRAVHDFFGHAMYGLEFDAQGEYNAWRVQSGMYSDLARCALTTELLGRVCWVNFGPQNLGKPCEEWVSAPAKVFIFQEEIIMDRPIELQDRPPFQPIKGIPTLNPTPSWVPSIVPDNVRAIYHDMPQSWTAEGY